MRSKMMRVGSVGVLTLVLLQGAVPAATQEPDVMRVESDTLRVSIGADARTTEFID